MIDGHAHLNEIDDLHEALQEAHTAGVKKIIAVGTEIASNSKTLKIAEANPGLVYPALGYHPWEIKEGKVDENLSFIRNHVNECIALGEIGLDYKVKLKKELQWSVFSALLDMANEFGKPVIVHCRFSHKKALEMAIERTVKKAVFHWYSGSLDLLEKILSAGYYISATPALKYSPPHQEAIKKAPLERILLETDTPVVYQGTESRPKDLKIPLEEVARLKRVDPELVEKQTTQNISLLFHFS
jgi:TatD DNase family protein